MEFPFPYFGIDQDQATMIILAFGQQTEFFMEMSRRDGFWNDMVSAFGLVGFLTLIISWLTQRISGAAIFCWGLIFLLLAVGPFQETVFFHTDKPLKFEFTNTPYSLVPGGAPIPKGRTPGDDIRKASVIGRP